MSKVLEVLWWFWIFILAALILAATIILIPISIDIINSLKEVF